MEKGFIHYNLLQITCENLIVASTSTKNLVQQVQKTQQINMR